MAFGHGPFARRILVQLGDFFTVLLARTDGQCVSYRNSIAPPQYVTQQIMRGSPSPRYPFPVPSPGERGVMRFLLSRRQVRLLIGAAMLLLIQGTHAPAGLGGMQQPCSFECSETRGIVNLDALITGWTSTEIESDPAGDLSTRPKPSRPLPCSGPSCSGRVPLPVSASVVGAVDPVQWGVLSDSFDLVPSPGRTEWADESLPDLTVNPSPVFHPPRHPLILGLSYVGHCGLGGEFECGITHAVLVPRVSLPSVPRLSESWDEAQQKPRWSYSIPDR